MSKDHRSQSHSSSMRENQNVATVRKGGVKNQVAIEKPGFPDKPSFFHSRAGGRFLDAARLVPL